MAKTLVKISESRRRALYRKEEVVDVIKPLIIKAYHRIKNTKPRAEEKAIDFQNYLKEKMKNPKFKKEYEKVELKPKND